jgi:hypothetical protein
VDCFEVFSEEIYKINAKYIKNNQYVVIYMGSNHCYTGLYFANKPCVKTVFAFELILEVYERGQKCSNLNRKLSTKLESHCFGLGNKDATIDAWFLPDRDGVSTMNESFMLNYVLQDAEMAKRVKCSRRQSSKVLRELLCDQTDDC